jgi:hypothetical protein
VRLLVETAGQVMANHARCDALETITKSRGEAALIYLDPPFGTGKCFYLSDPTAKDGNGELAYEDPCGDQAGRLTRARELAYACLDALAYTGTVVVHTDINCGHIYRIVFDEVFGPTTFRGEIVVRSGWRNAAPRPHIAQSITPTHNTLLIYSRKTLQPIQIASHDQPHAGATTVADTLWTDIDVRGRSTVYPTEKSRALAERLVEWLTNRGELVVEPFAGSGTVSRTALTLGRRVVLGDTSNSAAVLSGFGILSELWRRGLSGTLELPVTGTTSWATINAASYTVGVVTVNKGGVVTDLGLGARMPELRRASQQLQFIAITDTSACIIDDRNRR